MGYQQAATTNSNANNSMQLMPYTAQTKTLNPDELTKLYNMNPYNRPIIGGNSFPNVSAGIPLGQQLNHNTNVATQMSLAQANTNPAQFLSSTPYLQQQGTLFFYVLNVKKILPKYRKYSHERRKSLLIMNVPWCFLK